MKFNIIVIIINKNSNIFIHKYKTKDFKYGLLGFNVLVVVKVTSAYRLFLPKQCYDKIICHVTSLAELKTYK